MFYYKAQNIHKWQFWHSKSKAVFCLTSGVIYGLSAFLISTVLRYFLGYSDYMIGNMGLAIGAFAGSSFFSLSAWYENEQKYKVWIKNAHIAEKRKA